MSYLNEQPKHYVKSFEKKNENFMSLSSFHFSFHQILCFFSLTLSFSLSRKQNEIATTYEI